MARLGLRNEDEDVEDEYEDKQDQFHTLEEMIYRDFCIIIDGPNFIKRLIEHGKSREDIVKDFSISSFINKIQRIIREDIGSNRIRRLEFICSEKKLCNELNAEDTNRFLDRIMIEPYVSVYRHKTYVKSGEEKSVDVAVTVRMIELSQSFETIVLVASDTDYLPVIDLIGKSGNYVVTVGYRDKSHNKELIARSSYFIDLFSIIIECFGGN